MQKIITLSILLLFLIPPLNTVGWDINDIIAVINEEMLREYIQTLQDFGPRVTGTQACWEAGNFIYEELVKYGYTTYFIEWNNSGYEDRNIEAILPGEKNDSIIVCAHYDSVPSSPGADDNGSGTSAVLAIAKALSNFKVKLTYTIRFVLFSGEEEGLLGSFSYATNAVENNMPIIAVLNADMIGYTKSDEGKRNVYIFDNKDSKWIANIAVNCSREYGIGLNVNEEYAGGNSDHWPFMLAGYNAVFFHEYEFNDYYHTSLDTIDKMDLEYAVKVTRLIASTLLKIANINIPDNEKPVIHIQKPKNYLYIWDKEIIPTNKPIIIGEITLQVDAYDNQSGISKIEIYIDDELKIEIKNKPYEWLWDELVVGKHEIKAMAYDNAGNSAFKTINVTIFNLGL